MAELLFLVFLLPFHTIYIVLGGLLVRTTGRLTEWGSLSWARTTKAGMNGRRALGEGLGRYCLSQEKVLHTGLLVYFRVAVDCSLIPREKFQVEFK